MKHKQDGHVQRSKWLAKKAADAAKVLDAEVIPREQHRATLMWIADYLTLNINCFRENILDLAEPDAAVASDALLVRRTDFIAAVVTAIPMPDDEYPAEKN